MIIGRIPLRVSFCGGGSDIPFFIEKFGYGEVITTSIQKYIYTYINDNQYHDSYFIKYSSTEHTKFKDNIQHPVIRYLVSHYNVKYSELGSIADIPGKSGLGSSSAFTASMLATIHTLKGLPWTKEAIAKEACDIEIGVLKEKVGYQDAYSCVFGGINRFRFHSDSRVERENIPLSPSALQKLESEMVLVKTVFNPDRQASKILDTVQKVENFESQRKILDLVDPFYEALGLGDTRKMGLILNENWEHKKSLSQTISNSQIDDAYQKLMHYGAYGGKLLGAGGTGFLLMLMPQEKIQSLPKDFPDLIVEPFVFDSTGLIVHDMHTTC